MDEAENRYQSDIIRSLYGDAVSSLIPVLALIYILLSVIFYKSPYLIEPMNKWWILSAVAFSVNLSVVFAFIAKAKKGELDYQKWAYRYDAISFITGISHGYFCTMLEIANETVAMSYISFIVAAAIGSSVNAGLRPAAITSYLIPIFIFAGFNFWNSDYFAGFLLTALMGSLLASAFSYKGLNILKKSIDLRFENEELIKELTEQKELERQANLDKSRFISAASHDLRQPLQSTNFMFAALKSKLNTAEQKTFFDKTQNSLDSLNLMIDSLLDISRFDSGTLSIATKKFNVKESLSQEISQHMPEATTKDISIYCKCDESLSICFDPILLRRIISNLIDNAIKHSESQIITIAATATPELLQLTVRDDGIGIPEQHQSEIFKEFYQINNPERDRRKGTGLGLSIISRLIEHLNGEISLESAEGKGTTFKISIPLEKAVADESTSLEIKKSEQNNIVNSRIVVIDDDKDVLESLEMLLEDWGVRTICVSNEAEAMTRIEHLSSPDIDVIIADYRLRNNRTGLEAITAIKAFLGQPTVPTLVITGDTEPEVINTIKASGSSLLSKPISAEALQNKLYQSLKENTTET
ncbi:MAG: ATP-binding protein [Oleiphilus sp.]